MSFALAHHNKNKAGDSKKSAGQPGQLMENIRRNCASCHECEPPDKGSTAAGNIEYGELTIAVDREEKTLLKAIKSRNVGHTWVKLRDSLGNKYSYGFWPQNGFDADDPAKTVAGCVVHPDVIHDPEEGGEYKEYVSVTYRLNPEQYSRALSYAINTCKKIPNYNLFRFNCTILAIRVAREAGVSPPHSSTLAIHNPNALARGILRRKRLGRAKGEEYEWMVSSPEQE